MERKMTNRDRAEAYYMRLNGKSFQEIADQFGVSRQRIHQILNGACERAPRRNLDTIIYPAIKNYMKENRLSFSGISRLCGINLWPIINGLCGKNDISKHIIDAILDVTGMTYEEAFKKEDGEKCTPTTTESNSASGPEN